jgi:hypothetical protein
MLNPTPQPAGRITRNAARCRLCDTTIESRHRHDYVTCPCEALAVDGGHAYLRRMWNHPTLPGGGPPHLVFEELSTRAATP